MQIEPFAVEPWMNAWETRCASNLAETCVQSLTVQQFVQLAGRNDHALSDPLPRHLTYGATEGSKRLRTAITAPYDMGSSTACRAFSLPSASLPVKVAAARTYAKGRACCPAFQLQTPESSLHPSILP
ncbi:MAG: hypothetical protein AAFQ59_07405 [Pseudomonadota bacterium]